MNRHWILTAYLILASASIACKSQSDSPTPQLGTRAVGITSNSSDDAKSIQAKSEEQLSKIRAEVQASEDQSAALQKRINELNSQLTLDKEISDVQRKNLETELATIKKQKEEMDAQLKALADKQAVTEKALADAKAANSTTNNNTTNKGTSGFPFCAATYYGDLFPCSGQQCAKSDAQFQNICEVTVNSKPAGGTQMGTSGNPLCGAVYYGDLFPCNGKQCGKSDPGYKNVCEITANTKAAVPPQQASIGASGYPYCPATRYGTVFDCNGRQCAKSDPEFKNYCEIK